MNVRSIQTFQALLSLGASPNYKDRCGLTPLYHTVLAGGDTSCCETLLYYRAKLGTRDENGWDESHQVPADSLISAHQFAVKKRKPLRLSGGFPSHYFDVPGLCLFSRELEQCATIFPILSPSSASCAIVLSQRFLTPPAPLLCAFLTRLSILSPSSPLLSLHSTGTKRSLEWKKCIRYPSSPHPIITLSLSFLSQRHRKEKKKIIT